MPEEKTADTSSSDMFAEKDDRHGRKLKKISLIGLRLRSTRILIENRAMNQRNLLTMKHTHIPTHSPYSSTNLRLHHGSYPQNASESSRRAHAAAQGSIPTLPPAFELAALEPTPSMVSALSQQFSIILTFGRTTRIHKVGVSKIQQL